MGQLASNRIKQISLKEDTINKNTLNIKVLSTVAKIDNHATIIDEESPAVLKYLTPHFR